MRALNIVKLASRDAGRRRQAAVGSTDRPIATDELHVSTALHRAASFSSKRLVSSAAGKSTQVPVRKNHFLVQEYLAMVRRRPVTASFEDEQLAAPRIAQPVGAPISSTTLRRAFDTMDTDSSGSLDRAEIRQLLIKMNTQSTQCSDESLDAAITNLDKDGDGLVSFDEFETCWRSLENRSRAVALSPLEQALASGVLSSVREYQASLRARR